MRKPIELRYSDLMSAGAAPGGQLAGGADPGGAAPGADPGGAAPGAESGGEFMGSVQSMMNQANSLITNFKELLSMIRGAGGALAAPGGHSQAPAIYQPQPTMEQQLHRIVNVCYAAYGDIAIQDLIQGLLTQYGKTRLSQILKALEGG